MPVPLRNCLKVQSHSKPHQKVPLCLWVALICCPVHPEHGAAAKSTLCSQLCMHLELSSFCFPAFHSVLHNGDIWSCMEDNSFAPQQLLEPVFVLHSKILLSFHPYSGRMRENRASYINSSDVTPAPESCSQPGCSKEPGITVQPATRVAGFGKPRDGDGPGTAHSQDLTIAPPPCCGMEQSLQALVPEERCETSR